MRESGWDISAFHGNEAWRLPIPATFVMGSAGLVKARFGSRRRRPSRRGDLPTSMAYGERVSALNLTAELPSAWRYFRLGP